MSQQKQQTVTITYIYYISKDSYLILLVKIVIVRLYIKEGKTAVFTIAIY